MRYLCLFVLLLLSFQYSYSQSATQLEAKYDQLIKELKSSSQQQQQLKKKGKKNPPPATGSPTAVKAEAANVAIKLADEYLAQKEPNYQKAIHYYGEAIKLSSDAGEKALTARAYRKLAEHYDRFNSKFYNEALVNYTNAGKIYKELHDWDSYIRVLIKVGNLHLGKTNYDKAIGAFSEALKYAKSYKANKVSDVSQLLASVYARKGDQNKANYYNKVRKASDEVVEAVKENITKYDVTKEKEKEIINERAHVQALLKDSATMREQEKDALRKKQEELSREEKKIALVRARLEKEIQGKMNAQLDSLNNELGTTREALDESEEEKKRQLKTFGFITAAFLLFLAVVSMFSYRLNKVNKKLAQQKKEIEKQKVEIEKERDKSEQLLLNILPKATADELKEKGFAVPQHYDMVSVLFTDFKGFTTVAEKLSPADIIKELNICFLAFDEICEKHNMEKIKTIGDAYMCAGGIPIANKTNPVDAVRAGLAMQKFMMERKIEKEARGEVFFELRLGINTGPVVAGVVGRKKFAYDIWGDAVNLASRLESSGEVGMVNISEATYKLVKDKFYCAYRGEISAKNKGNVAMYFAIEEW